MLSCCVGCCACISTRILMVGFGCKNLVFNLWRGRPRTPIVSAQPLGKCLGLPHFHSTLNTVKICVLTGSSFSNGICIVFQYRPRCFNGCAWATLLISAMFRWAFCSLSMHVFEIAPPLFFFLKQSGSAGSLCCVVSSFQTVIRSCWMLCRWIALGMPFSFHR